MNISELREALNESDMTTEAKAEIIETIEHITELANLNQALVKIHTRVPLIYYAAATFGLGSVAIGMFSAIPFAVICGIAVFLVAFVGILEVVFARREIGDFIDEETNNTE